jgi:hypothetical protein
MLRIAINAKDKMMNKTMSLPCLDLPLNTSMDNLRECRI